MREANLSGANLSGAELVDTNFGWADLTYANLLNANLVGTNFTWANLTGAIMTRWGNHISTIYYNTTCPDGSVSSTYCSSSL
jgi:hypothetical protein